MTAATAGGRSLEFFPWNLGQSSKHSIFSQEASLHAAVVLFTQVGANWIKGPSNPENLVFSEYVPKFQPLVAGGFPEPEQCLSMKISGQGFLPQSFAGHF